MNRYANWSLRLALLVVFGLGSLAAGCRQERLTALRPEFAIEWSEDQGFVSGALPDSSLLFGTVTTGQVSNIEIRMSNGGNADLEMRDLYLAEASFDEDGALLNEIRVDADPELSFGTTMPDWTASSIASGNAFVFDLRFNPLYGTPLRGGLYLVVIHELNEDAPLYVPIVGEGFGTPAPDIYANPEFFDFGNLPVGQSSPVQPITIGNSGPGLLETYSVQITGPDAAEFELDEGDVPNTTMATAEYGQLTVTFSAATQGTFEAQVEVASNDADEAPLIIPLYGAADTPALGDGPVAMCGADFDSMPLLVEQFDGSASYDPDGLALTYHWSLSPPAGSATLLSDHAQSGAFDLFPGATDQSDRPYTWTQLDLAGDYTATLQVSNPNGQLSQPCSQTIHAIPNENFRIEMYWDQEDDMDLHLLEANPPGSPRTDGDCYFSNCTANGFGPSPDWGVGGLTDDDPRLDLDDIAGLGPENINIIAPDPGSPGWYQVFVHDYTGSTNDNYGTTNVTVNIYLNGVLQQTYNFGMQDDGDDYYVAKIEWPSGAVVACNGLSGC